MNMEQENKQKASTGMGAEHESLEEVNYLDDNFLSRKEREEYAKHNEQLYNSPEYKEVIDDVMKEVYTSFTKSRITGEKHWQEDILKDIAEMLDKLKEERVLRNENWRIHLLSSINSAAGKWIERGLELEKKIKKANALLDTDPEKAAGMFSMRGMCHWIWGAEKRILQEKYGMTWYTPAEVNPHILFD